MITGVNVRDERFQPIGVELDRTFQHDAERPGRHFIGIGVDLNAE